MQGVSISVPMGYTPVRALFLWPRLLHTDNPSSVNTTTADLGWKQARKTRRQQGQPFAGGQQFAFAGNCATTIHSLDWQFSDNSMSKFKCILCNIYGTFGRDFTANYAHAFRQFTTFKLWKIVIFHHREQKVFAHLTYFKGIKR